MLSSQSPPRMLNVYLSVQWDTRKEIGKAPSMQCCWKIILGSGVLYIVDWRWQKLVVKANEEVVIEVV